MEQYHILLGIIFIIWELLFIIKCEYFDNKIELLRKEIKFGVIDSKSRFFMLFNFFYFIWTVLGIFTPVWPLFLALFILSILQSKSLKNLDTVEKRIRGRRIDSTFSIILISFTIYFYFFS